MRQIVDEVKKVTGLPFTEAVMARRAGDPPHLIGSPKRINEELGWHAKYDVEDIVKSAWDAWQANPEHHIDIATWKQVGRTGGRVTGWPVGLLGVDGRLMAGRTAV